MGTEHLNLARKWRSRNFDQVVGQDLSVRILKNSLYLQHFFPVYLFSGQHGCGKTTTARIFAGALNCAGLELFQKDPKNNPIPCLHCDSCLAMAAGNHPDFIEIDAASHTGVDNVRHIIDIAVFLPIMGRKKIYLIDEAHMLSKAAFNAFLKILEEPPASALFILATTELHKIIETVRSRTFQLLFRSVSSDILLAHLEIICQQEKISYEREGLLTVIKQAKGSVRDALNLLEQVRFESSSVTQASALRVFGHTDDETIVVLFETVIRGEVDQLLQFLNNHSLESFCVETLWKSLIELINACIWVSYKMDPKNFLEHKNLIQALVSSSSLAYFNGCLKLLYDHELLFVKTGYPWYLFETLLMRMCQASKNPSNVTDLKKSSLGEGKIVEVLNPREAVKDNNLIVSKKSDQAGSILETKDSLHDFWKKFITQLAHIDPMLSSLFKQAYYDGFDESMQEIVIVFGIEFNFFNEIIQKSETLWKPLLHQTFHKEVGLKVVFKPLENNKIMEQKKSNQAENLSHNKNSAPKRIDEASVQNSGKSSGKSSESMKNNELHKNIDTSNTNQWKKASLLKTMFSGTIREVAEGSHE